MIYTPSPNFNDRKDGKTVQHLILHYTETETAAEAIDILTSLERQVSAHYVLGDDGTVYQLVAEDKRAWHAGKSYWQGEMDINSTSIGIEIQNPGKTYGYKAFPAVQIQSLITLCHGIIKRHGILPHNVLAHSDVAITRKIDPDYLFPWQELSSHGIGFWPQEHQAIDTRNVSSVLTQIGYDPAMPESERLIAFQRHFVPEAFKNNEGIGVATALTLQRLSGFMSSGFKSSGLIT